MSVTHYDQGRRAAERAGAPRCRGGAECACRGPCDSDLNAYRIDLTIGQVMVLAATRLDALRLALAYAEDAD